MPLGAALSTATTTLVPAAASGAGGRPRRRVEGDDGLVEEDLALARHGQRDRVAGLQRRAWPRGRFTASECRFWSESEASMNVASRKNMTSIIGMISMRPAAALARGRSFTTRLSWPFEPDVVDDPRAELLHLVHDLGLAVREVVEGEERDERDEEARPRWR